MSDSPLSIKIISAGAGSGKTYSLTSEMTALLRSGVRASGIVATTFTKKAATELQERVRVRLLQEGLFGQANELGQALIGTVHSLGTRLLQRFAFEAGVSPLVEIMAEEDGQTIFNQSLAQVLLPERIEAMNALAERLGLTKKGFSEEPYDWRKDIRTITETARGNDFSIEILQKSKARSVESLLRYFGKQPDAEPENPKSVPTARDRNPQSEGWNSELKRLLAETISALESNGNDETSKTKNVIEELRGFQNQLAWRGELNWHEWVKISKLDPAVKSRDLFVELKELARSHDENPLFLADIQSFTEILFETAIAALTEFEGWKRKRGLIDYTDMEALVNQLLDNESVKLALREELDLLLVDEFQDTSPIQLSIFLKLSRLARHSIWVGDPKQSIYGFRGADPSLMAAVIEKSGGIRPENILPFSWRSVPDLVNASNAIFCRAFSDLPAGQVALQPKRPATRFPNSTNSPIQPIQHWQFLNELDHRKTPGKPWTENCLATELAKFIERQPLILPKGDKVPRPVQPGDVAILCRSNTACADMAEALHRAGLKAAIARTGLLYTSEAKLILACLKFILNGHDALAIAEILTLAEDFSLERLIAERLDFLEMLGKQKLDETEMEVSSQKNLPRWAAENPFIKKLNDLRAQVAELSSAEILDLVLVELDLRRVVARWENPTQRLDNVDVTRSLALTYEANCHRLHSAASLGGFLLWLVELERSKADNQGSGESPEAIHVMTYHKSKGLEFPVVVLHGLEGGLREAVWGANLVAETPEIDLDNILGNRWLRFWVNPYADQLKATRLMENLETSDEFHEARRRALTEEARLLYVGVTRARDFLIFPTTTKPTKWLNRVFYQGIEDRPVLDADSPETPFEWNSVFIEKTTETTYHDKEFGEKEAVEPPFFFHAEAAGQQFFMPYFIDPAADVPAGWQPVLGNSHFWGSPLPFKKQPDEPVRLLAALHEFLLADQPHFSENERLDLADHLIALHGCREEVASEMLLAQADSFWSFFNLFSEKNSLKRACPVRQHFDGRLFESRLDLVFETENETFLFLFSPWTDGSRRSKHRATELAPLLYFIKKTWEMQSSSRRVGTGVRAIVVFAADGTAVEV